MSDINNQDQINLINSIKDQHNLETKTSLELLNQKLKELHKNILKESSSINAKNSIHFNNKDEEEQNKDNIEYSKKENISRENKENIIKENNMDDVLSENNEKEKENSISNEINENSDKIDNNNINKFKNLNDYKTTNDINIINSIGIKKREKNTRQKNEENKKNEIMENNNNEIKKENEERLENNINNNNDINSNETKNENKENNENNIYNNTDIKNENENKNEIIETNKEEQIQQINKNKQYEYKSISNLTESNILQEELLPYNISQVSELYLNEVIDKLGGFEEDNSIKEDGLTNESKIDDNILKERDSESVKIDSKEDLKLGLTNIPFNDENDNTSLLTNELNKACIRTNDNVKSKDISNFGSDLPREDEKEDSKKLSKKNTKNSNSEKKNGIELLFDNQETKKDEHTLIEETKKEIYNEINNMYEKKLNLVKINNKEKFSYITKYNDPDKEKLGYESDFFLSNKNSIYYLNRRNNFLQHKYFSYILYEKNKINAEKEKKSKNKTKGKNKDDSIDSNDNFEYREDKINKYKKNYNEAFEPITFNLNYIRANTQHDNIKEYKIYDIEDMTSFFYYFYLYSPEEDFKKILDDKTENDIINSFTTYRRVLNDSNSFKRAFSYLLLESFILQNKMKKLEFIIYDIKRMLNKKFKDIKDVCNILIDIKENSSIDYLMNSYNSQNCNFDEVMITYIEDTIKNVLGGENSKRKYQEIDFNTLRILVNIFDVNLEIYYIEEDNNKLLKMNKFVLLNDIFMEAKKNIKASNYNECESSTTFRLFFFLNSFYIVYTKKSDIDSTLANNNLEKQYYYISSLPKYKCPTCKKLTGLDIISSYEAIFCHICLTKYLQLILEKRAILFVKSNFSCIEYYTRPIKITSDIIITFSLYKYITKNYITTDFQKIVERICFKCFEIFDKDNINILKCMCQLCDNCLEKLLKENIKDKVCLNKYELNSLNRTKCLCENEVDLVNLMELSKNKPTEKDKKKAEERLLKVLKKKCCICQEKDPLKIYELNIINGPPHYICLNCSEKLNNEENISYLDKNKNEINNNNILSDYESNDTALKEKNSTRKKFFCKICYEEHISIEENNSEAVSGNIPKIGEGKFKCCKGNCFIF